jgi:hypothetical protein
MDDDMQKRLASMTEGEREEVRTFVARFEALVDAKVAQLLYELQDPGSEQAHQLRSRLARGEVPLVSDDDKLVFRKREALTLEDMRRFAKFLDADAELRRRQLGDLSEESEN